MCVHQLDVEPVCCCHHGQLWVPDQGCLHPGTSSPWWIHPRVGRVWPCSLVRASAYLSLVDVTVKRRGFGNTKKSESQQDDSVIWNWEHWHLISCGWMTLSPVVAEAGDEPPVCRSNACKSNVLLGVHTAICKMVAPQSATLCKLKLLSSNKSGLF